MKQILRFLNHQILKEKTIEKFILKYSTNFVNIWLRIFPHLSLKENSRAKFANPDFSSHRRNAQLLLINLFGFSPNEPSQRDFH